MRKQWQSVGEEASYYRSQNISGQPVSMQIVSFFGTPLAYCVGDYGSHFFLEKVCLIARVGYGGVRKERVFEQISSFRLTV